MSTSMLTAWMRDWGDKLPQQDRQTRQARAPATTEPARSPRRSTVVADIDIEKTVEDMRLLVLEKEVNLLREENELIKRLLDQMLAKRPLA